MTVADLYETYEHMLHGYAMRLAKDTDQSDDLVQETFVRTMGHLALLAQLNPRQQRRWLFQTLKRLFLDMRDAQKRAETMRNLIAQTHTQIEMPKESITSTSPFDFVPERDQDLMEKRYVLGMNSREIAEEMGIPAATVRSRLHLTMKTLRAQKHKLREA